MFGDLHVGLKHNPTLVCLGSSDVCVSLARLEALVSQSNAHLGVKVICKMLLTSTIRWLHAKGIIIMDNIELSLNVHYKD